MAMQILNNANGTWNPDYPYVVMQNVQLLGRTLTLPASADGASVKIKVDVGSLGAVTVQPSGGQTIDRNATYTFGVASLVLGGAVELLMNGGNWYIFGRV